MKRHSLLALTLVAVGTTLSVVPCMHATDLTGVGATFPQPIYTKWFSEYKKVDASASFNYVGNGSGAGKNAIIGTKDDKGQSTSSVDFGASDGPMSDEELAKASSKILHIPTVAGAVALTYNLPTVKSLKLDGPTLADIYLGTIKKWNDPAIAKQNSGVKLPDIAIAVVHRAEGSGTSYIFTDYLSTVSPDWKSKVGKNTTLNWPTGVGAKGSDGVAGIVQKAVGSIGYVELIYALQNKMLVAEIKNAEGVYLQPTLEGVTSAMSTATIPEDFRFSMVNAPGKDSYPISGATWLLVNEQQKDAAKGKALVGFLKWMITEGEKQAKALDYAPLPEEVQKRVLDRINSIKS